MFREFCYYLYEIHTGEESDNNKFFSALIGISFFQGLNIISVFTIANYFKKVVVLKDAVIFLGVILWLSITIFNYFFLYRNKNEIIKLVEGYSTQRQKWGKILFVTYILATFALYAIV